jgi:nucleoside-diphosphate-sugar epimerase
LSKASEVPDGSVLVTGALGCIGAWTVRELLTTGMRVVGFDPLEDSRRLRHVTPPELLERVRIVAGDITDLATVEHVITEHGVDRIIHLAALQLPFCRADPPMGAFVNVVGTVNIFEAAHRAGIPRVVYTSSVAVFDQDGGHVGADAVPRPASHYGVYKLANEGSARAYWHDFGLSSIGVRPMTVYGPGRDRGLTSSPTRAMLAAVLGCRYEIGFGGTTMLHHAADVGRALVAAVQAPVEGSPVFNLNGVRAPISDIITILHRVVGPPAQGISAKPNPIPFPDDVDTTHLDIIGPPPVTPLEQGVASTVEFFRDLQSRGILDPAEHGLIIDEGVALDMETAQTA